MQPIIDQLNEDWTGVLQFLNGFVVPDWGSLVNLLPIFVTVFVVGPLLSLLVFIWFVYFFRKPRVRAAPILDDRRPAVLDADGNPVFPPGEPYSARELMVYGPGRTRSDSGDELLVACPKCGLVRPAAVDTCGNCGLSFTLRPPTLALKPAGPPPGGSAAA